jgi:hypothetical protein
MVARITLEMLSKESVVSNWRAFDLGGSTKLFSSKNELSLCNALQKDYDEETYGRRQHRRR